MPHSTPTILLVHGAFTDASIWLKVSAELQRRGFPVLCPALPMRSLVSDAAYLASILAVIDAPIVLVGHSYAGSVISYPSDSDKKIRALVYVAAFQPNSGESAGELNGRFPGSKLVPESLNIWATPTGQDIYLKRERFKEVYAADLDDQTVRVMAVAQRPVAASCLAETFYSAPLWKTIPSWAVVANQDQSIPRETLHFMADRAQSNVLELDSSHAVPASRPTDVTQIIVVAAESDISIRRVV